MATIFSMSIDDGHPMDLKTADMMARRGIAGTFFIPINNIEGYPVMGKAQIREIGEHFELGSHTFDHCFLDRIDSNRAEFQIRHGKRRLEDMIGGVVPGFCYPGGKYGRAHVALVKSAGFQYARTTKNLCTDLGAKPFEIATTCQFYPHGRKVYLSNFLRAGDWARRSRGLAVALKSDNWMHCIYALFEQACTDGGVFHLWGHSRDFEQHGLWSELDTFLCHVEKCIPQANRLRNIQLAGLISAAG